MRSYNVWLVPAAVMLVGFGSGVAKATAQTITFPFDATYATELTVEQITPDVSRVLAVGESTNAPYGLTNFISSNNYSQLNPITGVAIFSPDPTEFGLQGFPSGSDVFFGSGINKLIGDSRSTATFDFLNGTITGSGVITITDGEGLFADATGTLTLSQNDRLNPDPTAPLLGEAVLTGFIQAVPEPATGPGKLVGLGVIGAGALLYYRRRHRATCG